MQTHRPARYGIGVPPRMPIARNRETRSAVITPWLLGYGIFQASINSTRSLLLFYAAVVLGLTPAVVGLVDAASSAALALGALLLSFALARLGSQRTIFALSMCGTGLVTAGFAFASSAAAAVVLAIIFGLFLVGPTVLAPVLASAEAPASLRGRAFGQVSRVSASGGAAGIGATALWIQGAGDGSPAATMRILFVVLGFVAIAAAVLCYRNLKARSTAVTGADAKSAIEPASFTRATAGRMSTQADRRRPTPMVSDELVSFLVLSFILFAGMGMSFSGVHSYMVSDLKAPLALAMGALFGFKIGMYFGAGRFTSGRARLVPGQVLGLTGLVRAALVVLICAVGLLPSGLAMPFAISIITLWGVAGGALMVISAEAVTRLAVPGRWREALAFYAGWSQAGYIVGVWGGGTIIYHVGFMAMFLVAASLIGFASLRMLRA